MYIGCSSWERTAPSPVSQACIGTRKSSVTRIGWEHRASFRRLNAPLASSDHFTVSGRQAGPGQIGKGGGYTFLFWTLMFLCPIKYPRYSTSSNPSLHFLRFHAIAILAAVNVGTVNGGVLIAAKDAILTAWNWTMAQMKDCEVRSWTVLVVAVAFLRALMMKHRYIYRVSLAYRIDRSI